MNLFTPAQSTRLRQLAGVAPNAQSQVVFDALLEALDEWSENSPREVVPQGYVRVTLAEVASLADQAAAGREAFLEANKAKFLPQNRDAWAQEYDRDRAATQAHFASAIDLISQRAATRAASDEPLPTTLEEVTRSSAYRNWALG